ncbi:MAG: hypothetical protein Q8M03_03050 [Legionella sp.]|nr:hypothetical protein [Legionella sp.]
MKRNENWFYCIKNLFNEFITEQKSRKVFEIVGIEQFENKTLLIVRLEGRLIQKKTPQQIILDDSLIEGLSSKEVRAITYLAVLEKLAPDCKLISWELDQIIKEYKVTLQNKDNSKIEKISASAISKDKNFINKMSAEDANRIGYMAGINDTLKDFNTK